MTIALLVHAHPSVRQAYADALGCDVHLVNSTGSQFSAGYDERSGITRDCPTLDKAVKRYAFGTSPDEPVILIGFSAGCWAARAWLRQSDARLRTVGAMFLDGLHGGAASPLAGVLDYARMAMDDPRSRACVITHTQIVPPYVSTRATAELILRELHLTRNDADGCSVGSFHVRSYAGADGIAHTRQLRTVGPVLCQEYLAPLVNTRADTDPAPPPSGQSLGARALAWSLGEMRLRPAPSAVRRAEYFAPCVREAQGTLRSLGLTDGNWCAAGACYATRQVTQDGDVVPHLYRASGIELERDATRAGHWLPVADVREGRAAPEAGDLVILHRGEPGAWTRHVGRVAGPIGVGGTFTCVDANGPGWRMVDRQLSSQRLRGFVRYPQDRERLGPGKTDPELDRLLALAQAQAVGLDWESWGEERDT